LTRLQDRSPSRRGEGPATHHPCKKFSQGSMDTRVKPASDAAPSSRSETDLPVCPVLTRKIFRFFI
jgi:hypothetical protein